MVLEVKEEEGVMGDEGQKDDAAAWAALAHACICGGNGIVYDDDILLYDAYRAFYAYAFYNALYGEAWAFFAKRHLLQLK